MMNDSNNRDTAHVEAALHRVLGTPDLSAEDRLKHMRRFEDGQPVEPTALPRRQWSFVRRPAVVTAALIVSLIVLAGSLAGWLVLNDSPEFPAVAAAQQLLDQPVAGEGRHIVVEIHDRYSQDGGDKAWVMETWERTLADGTVEKSVEARERSGELIGRYLQEPDGWYLSYRGSAQSGDGEIDWLPDELNPTRMASGAQVDVMLAAYGLDQIETVTDGDVDVVRVDLTDEPAMAQLMRQVEEDFDQPVDRVIWEIRVNSSLDTLESTRLYALTRSGAELVINERQFQTWARMPAGEIEQAHFERPAEEDASELAFVPPADGALPNGLRLTSHFTEPDSSQSGQLTERAVFSGERGLTIDLTILDGGNSLSVWYPEGTVVQTLETSTGLVEWVQRDLSQDPAWAGGDLHWLTTAHWADGTFNYSLSSQSREPWQETDLISFIEAVAGP